jgi:hypothetical protein
MDNLEIAAPVPEAHIGKTVRLGEELSKITSITYSCNEKIPLFHLENGYVLNAQIARDENNSFFYA